MTPENRSKDRERVVTEQPRHRELRTEAYVDATEERWPEKAAEFRAGLCHNWPECRFCNRHVGIQVGLDAACAALTEAGEAFWREHPNASAGALLNHLERLWNGRRDITTAPLVSQRVSGGGVG